MIGLAFIAGMFLGVVISLTMIGSSIVRDKQIPAPPRPSTPPPRPDRG